MYHLDTVISLPSELILSLYAFQFKKSHKHLYLGPNWVKQTGATLSPRFRAELREAEMSGDWDTVLLIAYVYVEQHSNSGIDNFLDWLKEVRTGDLYELLSPYTNTFPVDLDTERNHFTRLLSRWNTEYFSKLPEIAQYLERDVESHGDVRNTANPAETAETITNGLWFEPADELDKVVLIPHYHYRPSGYILSYRSVTICHYPIEVRHSEEDVPPYQIPLMAKSLSVESRLRILKYLRSGPKKFTDVANYIGLAKGVTHDHLLSLRRSGFVRTHLVGCSPSVYSLRENAVERLAEELTRYLELYVPRN